MMALPSSCRGPLKTIMLAGFFLSCVAQLVQAQTRFFLTKDPQNPKVGQDVTLIPQGAPSQIILCQWFRESTTGTTGEILSYTQFEKNRQNSNGSAYTGRETLEQNCALRIRKLTRLDTGNYSVVIETIDQQSGQGNQGEVKILESYIYLQVNASVQRISIGVEPKFPKSGQTVTLTPQETFREFTFCQWSIQTRSGHTTPIVNQIPGEKVQQVDSAYSGRATVGEACSLQIVNLKNSDTNNYTVTIRTPQKPSQQQPGHRNHSQVEIEQEYIGHAYLNIAEQHTAVQQRISIGVEPKFPKSGQTVTLTPQETFRELTFCQWSIQTHSGHTTPIVNQIPGEKVQQVDSAYSGRATVGEACSLRIVNLKNSDTNNYTVTIRTPQKPSQQQPGHRNHSQVEQEYTGHVYLNIAEQHTGSPKGSSASLRYSAGVIAGGLLGSLAWADALKSLFSVLLGSFASWRPKLFP